MARVKSLLSFVRNSHIKATAYVSPFARVHNSTIDKFSSVGWFSLLDDVDIGQSVSIASHCVIGAPNHLSAQPSQRLSKRYVARLRGVEEVRCKIGDDVWIGAQSTISAGVSVGVGCIIGANSFVRDDLPNFAVAVGSPARIVRLRFDDARIAALLRTRPWQWDTPSLVDFYLLFGDGWTVQDLLSFHEKIQSNIS